MVFGPHMLSAYKTYTRLHAEKTIDFPFSSQYSKKNISESQKNVIYSHEWFMAGVIQDDMMGKYLAS